MKKVKVSAHTRRQGKLPPRDNAGKFRKKKGGKRPSRQTTLF